MNTCPICGTLFEPSPRTKKYCHINCKQKAYYRHKTGLQVQAYGETGGASRNYDPNRARENNARLMQYVDERGHYHNPERRNG